MMTSRHSQLAVSLLRRIRDVTIYALAGAAVVCTVFWARTAPEKHVQILPYIQSDDSVLGTPGLPALALYYDWGGALEHIPHWVILRERDSWQILCTANLNENSTTEDVRKLAHPLSILTRRSYVLSTAIPDRWQALISLAGLDPIYSEERAALAEATLAQIRQNPT